VTKVVELVLRSLAGRPLGAVPLLCLLGCALEPVEPRRPAGLEERMVRADPLHPEFERHLREGNGLFDCLLSIDSFLRPDLDAIRVRASFESLSIQSNLRLAKMFRGRRQGATAEEAACAFLQTLDERGIVYGTSPGTPGADSKLVSSTLLHHRGCCSTFSLLLMAYLDRIGAPSSIVCLPDHCFVRILHSERSSDVESTDFESPLRENYLDSAELAGSPRGGHYGRSLTVEETLWHYYVDRLWTWTRWRDTDEFCLRALERARAVLGSSCQSIEAQEARRYFQIAKGREANEARRSVARALAVARYRMLNRDHPAESDYTAALEELGSRPGLAEHVWAMASKPGSVVQRCELKKSSETRAYLVHPNE
jgi:hypothetical protein